MRCARTVHVEVLCVGLQARDGRRMEGARVKVAVPGAPDSLYICQCSENGATGAQNNV